MLTLLSFVSEIELEMVCYGCRDQTINEYSVTRVWTCDCCLDVSVT